MNLSRTCSLIAIAAAFVATAHGCSSSTDNGLLGDASTKDVSKSRRDAADVEGDGSSVSTGCDVVDKRITFGAASCQSCMATSCCATVTACFDVDSNACQVLYKCNAACPVGDKACQDGCAGHANETAIASLGAVNQCITACGAQCQAPPVDAGVDSGPTDGSKGDSATIVCVPDTVGFAATTVKKARKQLNDCTGTQIREFVDAVYNANSSTNFSTWGTSQANVKCVGCMLGDVTDSTWAPLLFNGNTSRGLNLAGCLELRGASAKCPQTVDSSFSCFDYACAACASKIPQNAPANDPTRIANSDCREKAMAQSCAPYATGLEACAAELSPDGGVALLADGGANYLSSYQECIVGLPSENDGVPSAEEDGYAFMRRFFNYFCGTGS
jgi:hypothetical protein